MANRAIAGLISLAMLLLVGAGAHAETAQILYNQAQAAFDRKDWNGAIPGFVAVLPANGAVPAPLALVSARLASALLHVGRFGEARIAADRALAALPADATSARAETLDIAGDAARYTSDYGAAAVYYRQAQAGATTLHDANKALAVRLKLAQTLMTVDPKAVGADVEGLLRDPAFLALLDLRQTAIIEDLRARAAMNAGDLDTAEIWIERAIAHTGPLTENVRMDDVLIRNDAGILYALKSDSKKARRYIAFSGAGHLDSLDWIGRFQGQLPLCAPGGGIEPSDSVILRFAIGADGQLEGIQPLYASRPGTLGETFARAASEWHWDPNLVAKVEPFWRNALVLQMRCVSRPAPDRLNARTYDDIGRWLSNKGVPVSGRWETGFVAAGDTRLAHDDLAAVPPLIGRYLYGDSEAIDLRLQHIFDANAAPPSAYAALVQLRADRIARSDAPYVAYQGTLAHQLGGSVPAFERAHPGDPSVQWLKLEWALALESSRNFAAALPILDAVLASPTSVLPERDPVRSTAMLHQAMLIGKAGQSTLNNGLLADSGLSPEQCAMFDTHPIRTNGMMVNPFPNAALEWGFEGYVQEAFDIDDEGRTVNVRTVLAYPPYIFGPSTEHAIATMHYLPPKIGERSVGCTAQVQSVSYRIAGRH